MSTDKGVKLDEGKNRLGLVFMGFSKALCEVGKVGTFGANKYTENGWQSVDNGISRYTDALFRHLFATFNGEEIDKESGLAHLSHVAWNSLAILDLYLTRKKQRAEKAEQTEQRIKEFFAKDCFMRDL